MKSQVVLFVAAVLAVVVTAAPKVKLTSDDSKAAVKVETAVRGINDGGKTGDVVSNDELSPIEHGYYGKRRPKYIYGDIYYYNPHRKGYHYDRYYGGWYYGRKWPRYYKGHKYGRYRRHYKGKGHRGYYGHYGRKPGYYGRGHGYYRKRGCGWKGCGFRRGKGYGGKYHSY